MISFSLHLILCNLFIALSILAVTAIKHLFKNHLSARAIYRLWSVLFVLMALPFIPVRLPEMLATAVPAPSTHMLPETAVQTSKDLQAIMDTSRDWMNDFSISVNKKTPAIFGTLCLVIWLTGILFMLSFQFKARRKLFIMKQSAVPIHHPALCRLFEQCCEELGIKKKPLFYSTMLLKSPVMTGVLCPTVYLPSRLTKGIADTSQDLYPALRHMLLHELVHYKQKDALTNGLTNLFHLLYWPNPAVWFAMNEIQIDREISCDTAVLKVLGEENALAYGDTLIHLAEKMSLDIFTSVSGMSGNMRQLTRRIRCIAAYQKPTKAAGIKSTCIVLSAAALLLSMSPVLTAYALCPVFSVSGGTTDGNTLQNADKTAIFDENSKVSEIDLSACFEDADGSFVFYDLSQDTWQIYNKEKALIRVSPDSTYKIYGALFALDAGLITPENSEMAWDGEIYAFDAWNQNQDLNSAMKNSVNWYFQTLEEHMGKTSVQQYIDNIDYGNRDLSGSFPSCWLESSLKISPAEQVYLLKEIFAGPSAVNSSDGQIFSASHINAVKDALYLYNIPGGALYGKTGTGNINNHNISGWFVGFAEIDGHRFFFATHIEDSDNASGSHAAEITQAILSDLGIIH